MSEEKGNKRNAGEQSNFDENEEKNHLSKSLKVAVISNSSNVANFQENSLVLRDDRSKVIIKVQKSPLMRSNLKAESFRTFDEDMKNESLDKSDSSEKNSSFSQKIYSSILVLL